MTSIVPIRAEFPPDNDIAGTLRNIADGIERGEYGIITTCVVVTGHTSDRPFPDGKVQQNRFEIFGAGPRCDIYTVRGLLLTAATQEAE